MIQKPFINTKKLKFCENNLIICDVHEFTLLACSEWCIATAQALQKCSQMRQSKNTQPEHLLQANCEVTMYTISLSLQ